MKNLNKHKVNLRKANIKDAELLFNWVNEKEVRENSFKTNTIEWEDHIKYLENIVKKSSVFIFIAEIKNNPVGQIRFEKKHSNYLIDYSVDRNYRGQGIGKKILIEGTSLIESTDYYPITFLAKVKSKNIASKIIFEKLGFNKKAIMNSTILFELKITKK